MYIADFETTVTRNTQEQNQTEVWASALTYMFDEDEDKVELDNTITVKWIDVLILILNRWKRLIHLKWKNSDLKTDLDKLRIVDIYFHNVRFDGTFIMNLVIQK